MILNDDDNTLEKSFPSKKNLLSLFEKSIC